MGEMRLAARLSWSADNEEMERMEKRRTEVELAQLHLISVRARIKAAIIIKKLLFTFPPLPLQTKTHSPRSPALPSSLDPPLTSRR